MNDELIRRIEIASDLHASQGNGDTVMLLCECKRSLRQAGDETEAAREHREFYQSIVYKVVAWCDRMLGVPVDRRGIEVGTIETALDRIEAELAALRSAPPQATIVSDYLATGPLRRNEEKV